MIRLSAMALVGSLLLCPTTATAQREARPEAAASRPSGRQPSPAQLREFVALTDELRVLRLTEAELAFRWLWAASVRAAVWIRVRVFFARLAVSSVTSLATIRHEVEYHEAWRDDCEAAIRFVKEKTHRALGLAEDQRPGRPGR